MIRLIIHSVRNRKRLSSLFAIAIVVILVVLPLSLTAVKDHFSQVRTDITHHSRGSYDILVRPLNSRNQVEQTLGVVESNYLSVGEGGIAVDEWKDIQKMEGVAVAAPVASVGYFTGMSWSFVPGIPKQSTRYTANYMTSNGIDQYSLGQTQTAIVLKSDAEATGRHAFTRFEKNNAGKGPPQLMLPSTYHLLVGIDPKSEAALTGLSFSDLTGDLPPRKEKRYNQFFKGTPIVKVMKLKDPKVPVTVNFKRDRIAIDAEKTAGIKKQFGFGDVERLAEALQENEQKYNKLFNHLKNYPAQKTTTLQIDFSEKLDPFESMRLMVNQDGEVVKNTKYGSRFNYGHNTIYYQASDLHYQINDDGKTLTVDRLSENNGVPVYRKTTKKGKPIRAYKEPPFFLATVGEYKIGQKEEQLAASPLGIYHLTSTKLLSSEHPDAESGTELHPTIYPGSFVPAPAHGVTTIEAAKVAKGEKPIDAIRVRVAGIDGYTEENANKIKQIAGNIGEKGFEVDVVAGASHQQMKVDVEGLGMVTEPWTTLGAAATIINGWNGTTLILIVAFAAVGLIYVISRLRFWNVEREGEMLLLSQLGWDKRSIFKKLNAELLVLSTVGFVIAVIIGIALSTALTLPKSMYLYQFVCYLAILIYIMVSLYRTSQSGGKTMIQPSISQSKTGHYLWKNLRYYRRFVRLPFWQLIVVSGLSSFVVLAVNATIEQTNLTVLGQYVNVKGNAFNQMMMVGAYVLAVLTVIEGLMTLLNVRQSEIKTLRSIGWDNAAMYKLLISENALWTGVSIVIGGVVSLIGYTLIYGFQASALYIIIGSMVGLYAIMLMTVTGILYYFINKSINHT